MLIPVKAHLKMSFLFKTLLPSVVLCLWFPDNFQTMWQCFCPDQFDSNVLVILGGTVVDVWWKSRYCISYVLSAACFCNSNKAIGLPWPNLFLVAIVPVQAAAHSMGSSSWIEEGMFPWELLCVCLDREVLLCRWWKQKRCINDRNAMCQEGKCSAGFVPKLPCRC